ncbi:MAG TPA: type II secretion system F family protein [Phycisphaerae bacterium]|nr:type II secretion system F family protein [Phycisphaerae bacterium]HNU45283.1 type II secretion system F family protein [Phycisphaerae bacterium]
MPSYTYRALSSAGQTEEGVLTAENYQVALRQLEERALFPVKVVEGTAEATVPFSRRRIKTQHLTTFYSQLADLLRAGVPMLRALDVLGRQSGQGGLPQMVKELREDVAGGMSLGDAMAKHPRVFQPLHSSMVRAGEQGGFLEDVLQRIALFAEKQDELRNKLIGSLIYPCILVVAGSAVVTLLMVVVVPKLRAHLRPETFNIMTKLVFAVSDFLQHHYLMMAGGIVVVVMAFLAWKRTAGGKLALEQLSLRAPLLGRIVMMTALCRFCRILGTLLHNGVPILQSLKIARDSAGYSTLATVIDQSGESVRKGESLSAPLGRCGMFPPAIIDMIAVAEESNNLETVLVQIADTNEARTARAIDLGVRVLEPILLVMMAMVVFCIAVALLLPILTMGSAVR